MKPLLSLGISTYNRANFLRILLESLVIAIPESDERVEVLISDNDGSDDTAQVVAEFEKRIPQLRYTKNANNIGAEGNMLVLADKSAGEYLWLLGDDDVVLPHGVKLVLEELKTTPDYLILNYRTIKGDGIVSRSPMFSVDQGFDISDHNETLSKFGLSNGLLTAIVFNRNAFLTVPRDDYW